MQKLFSVTSSLAVFSVVASLSVPARAACCNDFWSCAAAVATGGLSCAVEEAVNQINEFVRRVERTRAEGEARMKASIDRAGEDAASGCNGVHQETMNAGQAVKQARGRVEAAAQQQRDAKVSEVLAQATAKVKELEQQAVRASLESAGKAGGSNNDRRRQLAAMRTSFHAAFTAPLAGLLAPLVGAADPITAAATIALAAEGIQRIEAETARVMERAFDEFEAKAQADLEDLKRQKAEQQERSQRASALADAAEAAAREPSEANRKKLALLLDPNAATKPLVANVRLPKGALKLNAQLKSQTLPELAKTLKADAAFASKVKVNKNFDKPRAERTIQGELDKRLANKNEQELKAEEQRLLDETRAKFPKDERTRVALEDLIRAEVSKRAKVMKAPPAPIKPAPIKPALKPKQ